MINTLEDFVDFSHRQARRVPGFEDRVVVRRPGCSDVEIAALVEAMPGLPETYLSAIRAVNLNNIEIGYFQFGPQYDTGSSLVDKLIEVNSPHAAGLSEYCRRDGVYWVASWEADPIGVAHTGSRFAVGQIVIYNVGNLDEPPRLLAADFEQFLLLAATLQEISDAHRDDLTADAALAEFRAYRDRFDDARALEPTWEVIAGVVLGR